MDVFCEAELVGLEGNGFPGFLEGLCRLVGGTAMLLERVEYLVEAGVDGRFIGDPVFVTEIERDVRIGLPKYGRDDLSRKLR